MSESTRLILIAYIIVGPGFWLAAALAMLSSVRRMSLFRRAAPPLPSPPPRATILIPAKDEGRRIADCLRAALNQTYPDFNVIAIDDRSTDRTGAVMDELALADPRLRVLHIQPGQLPDGWTGKNHALHNGVAAADGKWLLFVDSDVVIEPDAMRTCIATAEAQRLGMLSLLLRLETHTLAERMILPLASATLAAVYAISLTNAEWSNVAFGNGQFLLINRSTYDLIGGHAAVREQYCEDIALARRVKKIGGRPRVALGPQFGAVRMYDSLATIFRGFARIYFAAGFGSPLRALVAIAFILFTCMPVYIAGGWGLYHALHPIPGMPASPWLIAAAAHFVLMTTLIGLMYRSVRNSFWYALLFPVAGPCVVYILARAAWMCVSRRIEWRGTVYTHAIGSAAVRVGPSN